MRVCLPALVVFCGACTVGVAGDSQAPDTPTSDPMPQPTSPTASSVLGGTFGAIAPYAEPQGRAVLVRNLSGTTDVSMTLLGMVPNAMYVAHVHNGPCQYQGLGHYKINPMIADTLESNELWLRGQAVASGVITVDASFQHVARGDALSIVVHDPGNGGAKVACADLTAAGVPLVELAGTFSTLPTATAGDSNIQGTVKIMRTASDTIVTLQATGLDKTAVAYPTHVHNTPCSVMAGGAHYKLDPSVTTTVETNEIWLPVTGYAAAGTANATRALSHGLRTDAQSVVIHRTIDVATAPKVACADIERATPQLPLTTSGTAITLPTAGSLALTGSAVMTRKLTGVTDVAIVMTGLMPNTTYKAHVHDLPCAFDNGGGHYKFDRAITDAHESNEIWVSLVSDAEGAASDTTWTPRIAGADAQSLVVHGPDSARLACFDLR